MDILDTVGIVASSRISLTGDPKVTDDYTSSCLHAERVMGSTAITHSAIVQRRTNELRRLFSQGGVPLHRNHTPRTLLGMVLDYRYLDPSDRKEFGMELIKKGAKFADFTEEDWRYVSFWGLTITEDLSSFDLSGKDLCEADLTRANVEATALKGCFVSQGTRIPFSFAELDVHLCDPFWINGEDLPLSPGEFEVWKLRRSEGLDGNVLKKGFSPTLTCLALQAYRIDRHAGLLPRFAAVALSEGATSFVLNFIPFLSPRWGESSGQRSLLDGLLHEQIGLLLGGEYFGNGEISMAMLFNWYDKITAKEKTLLKTSSGQRQSRWLDVARITFGFKNLAVDAKSASGSSLLEAYGLRKDYYFNRVTFTTVPGVVPNALLEFEASADDSSKWKKTPTVSSVVVSLQPGRILVTDLNPSGFGTLLLVNSSFERREFMKPAYWSPNVITADSHDIATEEDLDQLGFLHLFSKELNVDAVSQNKFDQLLISLQAVLQGYRIWLCDTSPSALSSDGSVVGLVFSPGMREAVKRLPEWMISGKPIKARFEPWKGRPWQNLIYSLTEPEHEDEKAVTFEDLPITPEILTILRSLVCDDFGTLSTCPPELVLQVQRFFNAGLQGFGSFNFIFA